MGPPVVLGVDAQPALLHDVERSGGLALPDDAISLLGRHRLEVLQEDTQRIGRKLRERRVEPEEVGEASVPHVQLEVLADVRVGLD